MAPLPHDATQALVRDRCSLPPAAAFCQRRRMSIHLLTRAPYVLRNDVVCAVTLCASSEFRRKGDARYCFFSVPVPVAFFLFYFPVGKRGCIKMCTRAPRDVWLGSAVSRKLSVLPPYKMLRTNKKKKKSQMENWEGEKKKTRNESHDDTTPHPRHQK